jgi:hypothetical protein
MASTLPVAADCCTPCLGQSTVSISAITGWYAVDTIAALRAIPAASTHTFASVGTSGSFWGLYRWNNDSIVADDGNITINPTGNTNPGRWEKIL